MVAMVILVAEAGNDDSNVKWPFEVVLESSSSLSDQSESKWLKKLSLWSMHQTLIELNPSDSIIDSKSLVIGTV